MADGPRRGPLRFRRETALMIAGLVVIFIEVINAEVLGRTFHYEFLIAGLALCGVSITQLGDRK